jgi:glycosyltransferase involved in cell wall biosynthesis
MTSTLRNPVTSAARGPAARPRVLVTGPNPPPLGGIVSVIRCIVEGPLAEQYDFVWYGTTSARGSPLRRPLRWVNSAVAVACGLEGLIQRQTFFLLREFEAHLATGVDLVHLHASQSYDFMLSWLFARAARRRGVPVVLHTHGHYDVVVPGWPPVRRAVFRRALRVPDRVVVLSESWRRWFVDWVDPERLAVLRNCVDADRFRPPETRAPREGLVALYVGATAPQRKGAYDLLAWAPEMLARVPGLRFVFVGEDVDRLEERRVRGTPLAGHIEFVGNRGPGEIEAYFHDADVLLMPSYAEGLPIVLLEAMAAGLPVIAAPVNGIPEALEVPAGGRLVAPGDRTGWVEALAELASDPAGRARMGAANRARIVEHFDVRPYAARLGDLYAHILRGRVAGSAIVPDRPRR